jgi:hypothetical protein
MLAAQAKLFTVRAVDLRKFVYGERAVASAPRDDNDDPAERAEDPDASGDSDDELFTMKGTHRESGPRTEGFGMRQTSCPTNLDPSRDCFSLLSGPERYKRMGSVYLSLLWVDRWK